MSYPTVQGRAVAGLLYREAQSCLTPRFANSTYKFFLTGTNTPTNVYQDGALTTPFPITGVVTADNFGRFPAIYLDTSIIFKVQFFNSASVQQWQVDPYVSQLSTVGTSALSAFGFQITPTGEITIPAPNTGGSGASLTLNAGTLGSTALRISANIPGHSALVVNSSATTGAQTATFVAANKPGTSTSSPAGWLPLTCDGVQYYTPIWHGNPFSPYVAPNTVNHVFTSGSGVETVPAGVSFVTISAAGAGGGGSGGNGSPGGGGGGGGAQAISVNIPVSVGQTFNWSVPTGGAGSTTAGGSPVAATVTGNGALSAISLTANSGTGATSASGKGAGGTASGGNSSNTSGSDGGNNGSNIHVGTVAAPGGNSAAGAAGGSAAGSSPGGPGAAPGGGGGGAVSGVSGGSGGNGQVQFVYS
jgi:hypothetical protein